MATKKFQTPKSFSNEPYIDFSVEANRRPMKAAIAAVEKTFGTHYPIIIGGERITTKDKIASMNPANPNETVGCTSKADKALVDRAVSAATEAFESWRKVSPVERAGLLFRAAEIMRRRKLELSAVMVLEIGKSWNEAIGDTAEAIDFLEFYARDMVRLAGPQPGTVQMKGERDEFFYVPLGVGAVIPPWNFPLAILCGMSAAAIAAGNTVVLKPSSDTPIIGAKFVEVMEEAGIPKGVMNFLPGPGSEVGDYLVSHPKVRFINFTGSMEVGLRINELASKVGEGQIWIKRVMLEMGGKDAILVDETVTDLDSVAEAIVGSAFGFQGQKCSACSRVIAVDSIHDELLKKVVARAKKLTVGPTKDHANFMGPVANQSAMNKITRYIGVAKQEGARLELGGNQLKINGGYFIEPTIFSEVKPSHTIAQEEIFGPVVAFISAKNFEDGLEIVNGTAYGLTGAFFSKDAKRIERAKSDFHVGNLYINRKCTGAMVGAHPFGGYNMSGTCSKAGGHDYLLLLMQGKSVGEKIIPA